jgi:antitoxin (DNA-binding transcriptional repressor) of toxin-antitoxin stability system
MKTVSIQQAQEDLSRLVEDAAQGDAFIIAKDGKPLVKVVAVQAAPEEATVDDAPKKRRIGFLEGKFSVPNDFDTMFAKDIEDMFYDRLK